MENKGQLVLTKADELLKFLGTVGDTYGDNDGGIYKGFHKVSINVSIDDYDMSLELVGPSRG